MVFPQRWFGVLTLFKLYVDDGRMINERLCVMKHLNEAEFRV